MFQEEEGFFVYINPSIGTANYYFEIHSPLAIGEKEMIMILFMFNPNVHDPERFQFLLEQFIRDVKQNKDIYFALHQGEIPFKKFQQKYDVLKEKIHSLYQEGLDLAVMVMEISK
jgi:hypothetical protein